MYSCKNIIATEQIHDLFSFITHLYSNVCFSVKMFFYIRCKQKLYIDRQSANKTKQGIISLRALCFIYNYWIFKLCGLSSSWADCAQDLIGWVLLQYPITMWRRGEEYDSTEQENISIDQRQSLLLYMESKFEVFCV